jgi:signal transduction histidine kinase
VKNAIRILMLEDSATDADLIGHALRRGGIVFSAEQADSRATFLRELRAAPPDLILSDYSLPSFDGYAALAIAKQECPDVPFIFVTGTLGEEVAIETLKKGATDYVLKQRLSRLVPSVLRALREAEDRAQRRRAEEELRQSYQQLRALSVYLQHVREEERIRIAREIHDELGQVLTGLRLQLTWLAKHLPPRPAALHEKARLIAQRIDETIQIVRRIATELRPGILDNMGLLAALEWQANEFQIQTRIHCSVVAEVGEMRLDQDLNTAFFRIFQEALTNVVRHANATRVEVRLRRKNGSLVLEVQDNGRGISEAELRNVKSIGLIGMRERAGLLGGEVTWNGQPGKGTTVTVRIPHSPRAHSHSHAYENSHHRRPRRGAAGFETNSR